MKNNEFIDWRRLLMLHAKRFIWLLSKNQGTIASGIKAIIFDDTFSDGQMRKTVDNSKLMEIINFEFTTLNQGISDTIDWFLRNYNNIRK